MYLPTSYLRMRVGYGGVAGRFYLRMLVGYGGVAGRTDGRTMHYMYTYIYTE